MICVSFLKISPISAIKLHIISLSTTASSYVTPASVGTSPDGGAVLNHMIKETFFWHLMYDIDINDVSEILHFCCQFVHRQGVLWRVAPYEWRMVSNVIGEPVCLYPYDK
jgi:hypothetical protein